MKTKRKGPRRTPPARRHNATTRARLKKAFMAKGSALSWWETTAQNSFYGAMGGMW